MGRGGQEEALFESVSSRGCGDETRRALSAPTVAAPSKQLNYQEEIL